MAAIRAVANDLDGNLIEVLYEGPRENPDDPKSRLPIGYLKPSGKTYIHPMFAFAKQVGAPDDAIRPAHRGIDGQGTENVSDQRWIYDTQEAAQLERDEPDRFVRVI